MHSQLLKKKKRTIYKYKIFAYYEQTIVINICKIIILINLP